MIEWLNDFSFAGVLSAIDPKGAIGVLLLVNLVIGLKAGYAGYADRGENHYLKYAILVLLMSPLWTVGMVTCNLIWMHHGVSPRDGLVFLAIALQVIQMVVFCCGMLYGREKRK